MLLGVHTVAFHDLPLEQALERAARLGFPCIEIAGEHASLFQLSQSPHLRERLKSLGLQLISNDPIPVEDNLRQAREVFEQAKDLDLRVLNFDAANEALPLLEGLSIEYDIPVAIHNQGPETEWANLSTFESALRNRERHMGMCVDTGLFLRVPENPLKVLHEFCDRIHSIYLRDIEADEEGDIGEEHPLGEGDLDLPEVLAELDRLHFAGPVIVRYEGTEDSDLVLEKAREKIKSAILL